MDITGLNMLMSASFVYPLIVVILLFLVIEAWITGIRASWGKYLGLILIWIIIILIFIINYFNNDNNISYLVKNYSNNIQLMYLSEVNKDNPRHFYQEFASEHFKNSILNLNFTEKTYTGGLEKSNVKDVESLIKKIEENTNKDLSELIIKGYSDNENGERFYHFKGKFSVMYQHHFWTFIYYRVNLYDDVYFSISI